jgi:5-hydroxyisourate hydrolase
LLAGTYKVRFATALYYEGQRQQGLYPYVDIVFDVRAVKEHYHIPLLLTANGYSTYRGS